MTSAKSLKDRELQIVPPKPRSVSPCLPVVILQHCSQLTVMFPSVHSQMAVLLAAALSCLDVFIPCTPFSGMLQAIARIPSLVHPVLIWTRCFFFFFVFFFGDRGQKEG